MGKKQTPATIFNGLASNIANNEDLIDVDGVLQFDLSGESGGSWVIDLTELEGRVYAGEDADADCQVQMNGDDFMALASGELAPFAAYQQGKLKVEGHPELAMSLMRFFRQSKRESQEFIDKEGESDE